MKWLHPNCCDSVAIIFFDAYAILTVTKIFWLVAGMFMHFEATGLIETFEKEAGKNKGDYIKHRCVIKPNAGMRHHHVIAWRHYNRRW